MALNANDRTICHTLAHNRLRSVIGLLYMLRSSVYDQAELDAIDLCLTRTTEAFELVKDVMCDGIPAQGALF